MKPADLDSADLVILADRYGNGKGQSTPNGSFAMSSSDYLRLFAFADYVINRLGIDVAKPGAVFDNQDPESGCEDVNALMSLHSIGDDIDVVEGYYTAPRRYRMVPTVNGKLCTKCEGKGCDDWAGEDCPSDDTEPMEVSEIEAALT